MSYFSQGAPRPEPNMEDAGFWQHCAERRLAFQICADCQSARHPPTPVCWKCRSMAVAWRDVAGDGEVFSFTVVHHAVHEAVTSRLPYVVAAITFPDLPGPRLISNLTDIDPQKVHIGMRVRLWWDDIGEGMFLPRFRCADDAGETQ